MIIIIIIIVVVVVVVLNAILKKVEIRCHQKLFNKNYLLRNVEFFYCIKKFLLSQISSGRVVAKDFWIMEKKDGESFASLPEEVAFLDITLFLGDASN